jgi:hypothetical protein
MIVGVQGRRRTFRSTSTIDGSKQDTLINAGLGPDIQCLVTALVLHLCVGLIISLCAWVRTRGSLEPVYGGWCIVRLDLFDQCV